ncbi:hypothetical protein Tb927.8.1760 [Trypanosoma brucei brucei TREU927]|uniref:Uncharacterized protein n=1 Tax=Trypanosoma brucei brucei (strain 927/4 GUTat10.1) TaxID=185431 RepID=Q582A6_TRYB2|nr:hypothetical protein Tb927.8.1760 [Trypanosoma brucei brucei TREU927]AAX79397.1 hypothetical protein Tb927.8.1760 [Trypanosoma brucei]AAZ12943.1 hypothetical protein Tb927.8.1760 [Trypanosoma brucei brucei TREU927]
MEERLIYTFFIVSLPFFFFSCGFLCVCVFICLITPIAQSELLFTSRYVNSDKSACVGMPLEKHFPFCYCVYSVALPKSEFLKFCSHAPLAFVVPPHNIPLFFLKKKDVSCFSDDVFEHNSASFKCHCSLTEYTDFFFVHLFHPLLSLLFFNVDPSTQIVAHCVQTHTPQKKKNTVLVLKLGYFSYK